MKTMLAILGGIFLIMLLAIFWPFMLFGGFMILPFVLLIWIIYRVVISFKKDNKNKK